MPDDHDGSVTSPFNPQPHVYEGMKMLERCDASVTDLSRSVEPPMLLARLICSWLTSLVHRCTLFDEQSCGSVLCGAVRLFALISYGLPFPRSIYLSIKHALLVVAVRWRWSVHCWASPFANPSRFNFLVCSIKNKKKCLNRGWINMETIKSRSVNCIILSFQAFINAKMRWYWLAHLDDDPEKRLNI